MLTAVLARLSSGRTGSTLLMQLLATGDDVVIDRAYPFENAYLPCFMDMARRVGADYERARDGTIHTLVEQLSSGLQARAGAVPFDPISVDRRDLQRRVLRKLWEAFSESAQQQRREPTRARHYAEKLQPGIDPSVAIDAGIPVCLIDVVRDPRDVVASIRAFNRKRGFASFGRLPEQTESEYLEYLIEYQRGTLCDIDRPLHGVEPILVRYEDMVEDLGSVAALLSAELGTSFDHDAVEAARSTFHAHMTSDGKADSMGRWQRDLDGAEVALIEDGLGSEMVRLGYSLSVLAPR